MAGIIVGLLNGDSKETVLSSMYSPVNNYFNNEPLCDAVKEVASGSFKNKQPPEIKGTGFVVKSLEAALWAFYTTDNFKEGAIKEVKRFQKLKIKSERSVNKVIGIKEIKMFLKNQINLDAFR